MSKADELELLSPPGDTILEYLLFELGRALGLEDGEIDGLISGNMPLTEELAYALQNRFGVDAQFWIRREALYRQKLGEIMAMDDGE